MPESRHAILIGTSRYEDERLPALRCPEQDVDGLAAVLRDPAIGRFDMVLPLKNVPHHAMLTEIRQVLEQASKDDLFLFYFSGHGKTDTRNRLYLIATNTALSALEVTSLPIETLKDLLDAYRTTRIIIILDCCFSGAAGASFAKSSFDDTLKVHFSEGRGKYLLTASTATTVAAEKEGDIYSVFTKHLIAGLQTGAADLDQAADGRITIDALYRYVYHQVRQEGGQEPMRWDLSQKGEHLIIAWRRAEVPPASPAVVRVRYNTIIQGFQQGEVIPFLGPGVLEPGNPPPVYAALAQELGRRANLQPGQVIPLTMVSQLIHMRDDRAQLYRHMKTIHCPSPNTYTPTTTHRFLAQIQRPLLIFSTSHDTLLEEAFAAQGKNYVVATHWLHPANPAERGKVVVQYSHEKERVNVLLPDELQIDLDQWSVIYKIHGTFDLLDTEGDEIDSLVISEEDYLALLMLLGHPQTTIPNQFVRRFRKSMFLFLGYHMYDWNFRAMLDIMQRRGHFERNRPYAVRKNAEEFERLYWEHKGVRLIDMDVEEFLRAEVAPELGIHL